MSTMQTITAYVVVGDGGKEHPAQDLGMFFKVTDADRHVAKLAAGNAWSNLRIDLRQVALSDVHPAHESLFPEHADFFKARAK